MDPPPAVKHTPVNTVWSPNTEGGLPYGVREWVTVWSPPPPPPLVDRHTPVKELPSAFFGMRSVTSVLFRIL